MQGTRCPSTAAPATPDPNQGQAPAMVWVLSALQRSPASVPQQGSGLREQEVDMNPSL